MTEPTQLLEQYAALLTRYHKTLDLLSDAGLADLPRHLDDALGYAQIIEDRAGPTPVIVDVGSGAGLPGIVIAAALPNATVHLVERRRRRTAFLELATSALGLSNAHVHGGDVQELDGVCADVITAQAVADLATLVQLTRHLHRDPCWVVSRRGDEQREALTDILAAAGLPPTSTAAEDAAAQAEVLVRALEGRGSLVAVRLPGGSACLPSA
ncbi:MAG: RsmG family class I SAM-dependent methyltransferase [Trueperaceae bacterium]